MSSTSIVISILAVAVVFLALYLYQNRGQAKTPVGKAELLIAEKREDLITIEKQFTAESNEIQRRIDECETKIHALKKMRGRLETEMEALKGRSEQRAKQAQAELNALLAESKGLQKPGTFVIPEGGSVEIRTNE